MVGFINIRASHTIQTIGDVDPPCRSVGSTMLGCKVHPYDKVRIVLLVIIVRFDFQDW